MQHSIDTVTWTAWCRCGTGSPGTPTYTVLNFPDPSADVIDKVVASSLHWLRAGDYITEMGGMSCSGGDQHSDGKRRKFVVKYCFYRLAVTVVYAHLIHKTPEIPRIFWLSQSPNREIWGLPLVALTSRSILILGILTARLVNTVVGEMHVAITQTRHVAAVLHWSQKLNKILEDAQKSGKGETILTSTKRSYSRYPRMSQLVSTSHSTYITFRFASCSCLLHNTHQ